MNIAELLTALENEAVKNGGQGSYAWTSRELCGQVARAIRSGQLVEGESMNIAELSAAEVPLQDRLKRIFDDAGGSDTLVDLIAEFGFSGSRELADVITAAIAYRSGQLVERGEPVAWMYTYTLRPGGKADITTKRETTPLDKGWTETPLYAGEVK